MDPVFVIFVAIVVYFGCMAAVALPILMLNKSLPVVVEWIKSWRRSKT